MIRRKEGGPCYLETMHKGQRGTYFLKHAVPPVWCLTVLIQVRLEPSNQLPFVAFGCQPSGIALLPQFSKLVQDRQRQHEALTVSEYLRLLPGTLTERPGVFPICSLV